MKFRIKLFFLLLCFGSLFYAKDISAEIETDSIVAKIGNDYKVSINDLKQYVIDWQYSIKYRNNPALGYKTALDALILNQLKRFDFFDRGFDKDDNILRNIRRTIHEEITVQYFDKQFVAKYANEKAAADAYKLMDKEIVYHQIVLPLKGDEKENKLDSLKKIAVKIQNDLKNSENVDRIIKKYSRKDFDDQALKHVGWEQSIKDPVAHVIFKLNKGLTQVIRSIDGFYIVKVKDIKKINVSPFDSIKKEIIAKLKEANSEKYQNEYENLKKEYVDESTLKWNDKGVEKIVEWSNISRFYYDAYVDTIDNIIQHGGNFEILSFKNGKVDLKEFWRLLDEVVLMNPKGKIDSEQVKNFVLEAVFSDFIVKKAREMGLEKNFLNPYTNNFMLKHRIALLYNKTLIDDKIPKPTEEVLHKFYDEQKDSLLYQLKKVIIHARIYSDSITAVKEINKIKAGTPFDKISNRWFVKSFIREQNGKYSSYLSTEPPYLAEEAFKLKLNDVAGPISYYDSEQGKQFAVIKCDEIYEEKQPTYNELKMTIKDEYQNYYREKISSELEKQLKSKYKVEIFENVLAKMLSASN